MASADGIKVLYIDGVGPFGGASRSLFEVMRSMPKGAVEPFFVMQRGTARDFYRAVATDIIATRGLIRFDHSRISHYRGIRWLVMLRELAHLPFTIIALLKARRRWPDIELIHINEIAEIFSGLIAKRLFGVPLILHTRSPTHTDLRLARTRWLHRKLRQSVDAVIAIDENCRERLPADVPVDVIHNSFSAEPKGEPDRAYLARLDALRPTSLKVGFVGNLHRAKGLSELLEAARMIRDAGEDVQFLVVGGTTAPDSGLRWRLLKLFGLAQNMQADLGEQVAAYGLEQDFLLLGPTHDIQRVYQRIDVLAFPSHIDAPGRPVFEAAFFGVPAIVAVGKPREDTVIDGETAIAIGAPDPRLLAQAILYFVHNRAEVARMGAQARALAERNFVPEKNARKLLAVYRRLLGALPRR